MNYFVNACVKKKGVDVGKERIQEIPAEPGFLILIEVKSFD
jgi:hypothetical protein